MGPFPHRVVQSGKPPVILRSWGLGIDKVELERKPTATFSEMDIKYEIWKIKEN
jgi:hypothetical protein